MPLSARPRRLRAAAGLAAVASSSVLLAGCVQITHQEGAQLEGVGDVAVTLDLCQNSGFTPNISVLSVPGTSDCALTDQAAPGKAAQVFITYAIPAAVAAPATISTPGGATGDAFVADDASTAALMSGKAAPAGYKWATYRSTPTPALSSTDTAGRSGKVRAQFDVSGLSGDFNYAALVSWRFASTDPADTAYAADRPVSCAPTGDIAGVSLGGGFNYMPVPKPGTSCAEAITPAGFRPTPSPSPSPVFDLAEARAGRIPATPEPTTTPVPDPSITTADGFKLLTVPVNRLALAGAAEQTVTAGGSATLSFGVTSQLAGQPVSVPLSGSTDAPGATVDTDAALAIGGSSEAKALVKVPATTAPGDYVVKLSAGANSGLRTATGVLHVKAAPSATTPAPTSTPAATNPQKALETTSETLAAIVQKGKKTRQLRRGAATVPVAVTGPGTVRVTIHARKKVGKNFPIYAVGEAYAKKAGTVDVTIKRTDAGRELLAGDEPVKATLVVRFSGPSGKFVAPGIFITLD